MNFAEFLLSKGVTVDAIAAAASERLGVVDGDVLLVSGSLTEGLGNSGSDVDLCLITNRTDIRFSMLNDVLFRVGPVVCDVQVVTRWTLDSLLKSFAAWVSTKHDVRETKRFSEEQIVLFHRLATGTPLIGVTQLEQLRSAVPKTSVARLKLERARYYANTLQVDLAGLRSEGQWTSALFVAQTLLDCTVDALLAAYGHTNPEQKWRVKLLELVPVWWEDVLPGRRSGLRAVDRYLLLHRDPLATKRGAVIAFVSAIVAFSRIAFPWAERRILSPHLPFVPGSGPVLEGDNGDRLPDLDLDVAIFANGDAFELRRLNSRQHTYELSAESYSLLCLFDGETSRSNGLRHAFSLWGRDCGTERFNTLIGLVNSGGLAAWPIPDEVALRQLLNRR